ncbi:sensor histidine kinase [Desulfosediminicola ganghwensis]|uniref:sensor histidine kinase n=1 Tax=Desulfosediminicola ganghwensis TaxID=2569540 RepID=UPI0010AC669B|nr:ATP-binding protein [Desulfosediminicola ganghwensis]
MLKGKTRNPRKKFFLLSGTLFLIFSIFVLWFTSQFTYQRGLDLLSEKGTIKLELFVTYLQGVLEKYESLPELLAVDKNLVNTLQNPHEKDRIAKLNRYLETINSISDTADTYLMDSEGLTIAASNWQAERPFVGRNFSFRPYFEKAMRGELGRYFALGTTSSKRGYYFAYPVRKAREILGVVVIKINIDHVEQSWGDREDSFLVTDPDGVIFLTTNQDWRFKTIQQLEPAAKKRIIASRRYPNASLTQLSYVRENRDKGWQLVQVNDSNIKKKRDHLQLSRQMSEAGWSVHIMTDTLPVRKRVLWVNVMTGGILLLTYLLFLLLMQRQYRLKELARIREKTRRALQRANEKLEVRVDARTRELTKTNKLLVREIKDRQQTEAKLRTARNELIHAAKMAVLGQMSAGINHELNQPLAAIRSYADNGRQFLEKGRLEEALWNLEQIGELTERMAQIGIQLKAFSRKTSGNMYVVPLHGVIDGALEILRPSIRKHDVTIDISIIPDHLEVQANNLLLQQVLVNLLGNAVHAVEGLEKRKILVDSYCKEERVIITVTDSGAGIHADNLPFIFDPFFTTKKSGQGLGLGLAITDRILRDMNGAIRYVKMSEPGACFEIELEKAQ